MVLITGASSGLGQEIAHLWAKEHDLLLLGRDMSALLLLQTELSRVHPSRKFEVASVDHTKLESLEMYLQNLQHSKFTAIILNAGGGIFKKFSEQTWSEIHQQVEFNVSANLLYVQAFARALGNVPNPAKKIKIMIVSSHAAFLRVPHFSVYGAAKSYLVYFFQTLRQEARSWADVYIFCPGAMATKFSDRAGIPRMVSTPIEPKFIAEKMWKYSQKSGGSSSPFVFNLMDRLYIILNRLLPACMYDLFIFNMQKKFLKRNQT